MNEIEAYRSRIRQAVSVEEKQAIAAELHRLADTFDATKKAAYEQAMEKLREDIADRLDAAAPYARRAEELLNRIKSRVPQS